MSEAAYLLFTAARTLQFQSPPYDRPGRPLVLLLRDQDDAEPGSEPTRWRLPTVGEFEHPGSATPWVDSADLVQLDAPFDPPGLAASNYDFIWAHPAMVIETANPERYDPAARAAIRRLDGDLLDQILTRIPRADSITQALRDAENTVWETRLQANGAAKFDTQQGDDMSTAELEALRRENSELRSRNNLPPRRPTYQPGELHAIVQNDASGRPITRYVGHEGACWDRFNPGVQYVRKILVPGAR